MRCFQNRTLLKSEHRDASSAGLAARMFVGHDFFWWFLLSFEHKNFAATAYGHLSVPAEKKTFVQNIPIFAEMFVTPKS